MRAISLAIIACLVLASCVEGKEDHVTAILLGEPTPSPSPSVTNTPGCASPGYNTLLCVTPIKAVFDPDAKQTVYSAHVDIGANIVIDRQMGAATTWHYKWSGPDCGSWAPQNEVTRDETSFDTLFTWSHPHPPCDATTDHSSVTILLQVWTAEGGRATAAVICRYKGAADGTGETCTGGT